MKRRFRALVIGLTAASIVNAADAYVGKWRLNPNKSKLTGETVTVKEMPDRFIRMQRGDTDIRFKLDGVEYPMPDGGTTAWKSVSPNTWERVDRVNGKVRMTGRLSLQADVLAVSYQLMTPDGGKSEGAQKWRRVSGGPGLFGTWKSIEAKVPEQTVELEAAGTDGITLKFPDDGSVCKAKFDGKDYALTGPLAAGKVALSFKRTGTRSFEVTEKLEGKPVYIDKYTLSGDGETLTDEGTPVATKEVTTAVFDRQ